MRVGALNIPAPLLIRSFKFLIFIPLHSSLFVLYKDEFFILPVFLPAGNR
jgi:hypothetical protein